MTHSFACEVHYEDTDLSGFTYHANYLKFIERARSAWVRDLGLDQNAMRAAGQVFAVRRIEADFIAPARLGDRLDVRTRVDGAGPARLVLSQEIRDADRRLFGALVTLVAMTVDGRPTRLPEALRALPLAGASGGGRGA